MSISDATSSLPRRARAELIFLQLWNYRHFILAGVAREIRARYLGSLLGGAWVVLSPLGMILVYTFIFSNIMKARLPGVDTTYGYSIYLCAALLPWQAFCEVLVRCQTVFTDNANLIKKASFPRLCLPAAVTVTALINFAVVFCLFLIFLALTGQLPGVALVAVIPLLILQTLFAVGLGVALGVIHVFFRDVGQIVSVGLQFWFWGTPIVYPMQIIPENWRWLLELNPMYWFASTWQMLFTLHAFPSVTRLAGLSVLAALAVGIGLLLYFRHGPYIVDEL